MVVSLASLSVNWAQNSDGFRPSAFWFWNSEMTEIRTRQMIAQMSESGVREVIIHPIYPMELEYLSPEFFDHYRFALKLAREYGLKVWIYDEYGWPSGNAGGILLREFPQHRGWILQFKTDADGNVTAEPVQPDRVLDNTVGAPWAGSESGYLNTLSVESVGEFINLTHTKYYQECSEYFGDVIVGFFTDEPVAMMAPWDGLNHGFHATGMPWTPEFPARFYEKFGYDITRHYLELPGNGPSQVKADYWSLAKSMYVEAYHAQIGQWCRDHGVKHSGHVGEDWPLQQVRYSGSIYQCLSQMDEPGIDFLGLGPEPELRSRHQVLVPSIARHSGKDRVICEAYGISPYDIRLGEMLRRAQMFGINGIDDIALMAFSQSLDGVRKQTYWPPLFTEAPWWEFYPQFRDACAKSLTLTSNGCRRARYAILYPQYELEQADLLDPSAGSLDGPAARMIDILSDAIYAAGETFEFIFPEIISQAEVVENKIVFPHSEYDAILAPGDIRFFPESTVELNRLSAHCGKIIDAPVSAAAEQILGTPPSWQDMFQMETGGKPGDIRIYRFDYPDGKLITLRNITDSLVSVKIHSKTALTTWNPMTGEMCGHNGSINETIPAHGTLYFSVSESSFSETTCIEPHEQIILETSWTVTTERPNMARLSNLEFLHTEKGWLKAEDNSILEVGKSCYPTGIPLALFGYTQIEFRGEFTCTGTDESLSVLFESNHLKTLLINDSPVNLDDAGPMPVWDQSCCRVRVGDLVKDGVNTISGVLQFKQFETSLTNQGLLCDGVMPLCDVCICGEFRLLNNELVCNSDSSFTMPLRLNEEGWEQYDGIVVLQAKVNIDKDIAQKGKSLIVDSIAEDCLEVIIDGVSLGKCIASPYSFTIKDLTAGEHEIKIRISGTSANILAQPSPWGIKSVCWESILN